MLPPVTMATTVWPGSTATWRRSAADASAPAGSAITPSVWYRSSISLQIWPSGTVAHSQPFCWIIGRVNAPAVRTATPSAKVSMWSSRTGWPAHRAACMLAAPAGSTPITRVAGQRSRIHARQPASSPPPPTGTSSTSGASPIWSTISGATVPWPAMVRRSSKACTLTAPVASASAAAAVAASS